MSTPPTPLHVLPSPKVEDRPVRHLGPVQRTMDGDDEAAWKGKALPSDDRMHAITLAWLGKARDENDNPWNGNPSGGIPTGYARQSPSHLTGRNILIAIVVAFFALLISMAVCNTVDGDQDARGKMPAGSPRR